MQKTYRNYIGLFYFNFFSIGAMGPLLSQYLKSIGFNGTQIGTLVSLTSLTAILVQPFWGTLCDITQKTKIILNSIILATALIALFIPLFQSYYVVILMFIILYIFLSGISPISDALALNSDINYGKIRQWGAIGFAMSVFISGVIADHFGLPWIFILLSLSYLTMLVFSSNIKVKEFPRLKKGERRIKDLLKNKKYMFFLISTFFISGAIDGHNAYFGLLFEHLGGTITGIGIAFLLFAGSEAPFMKWTFIGIRKWGLENMIMFSVIISLVRYLWYSTSPTPTMVIIFFMLQGISIGTFLVSAAQFIRENTTEELRATAMSLYASVSMGLGGMICKFVGGLILEYFGINNVYLFLALFTATGLIPLMFVKYKWRVEKTSQ